MYNSRELYAFLGGLRNRIYLQALVKNIEKFFITKVDLVLTTGEMDSEFLKNYYGIENTLVIRNIPLLVKPEYKIDLRKRLNIKTGSTILIYQGVLLEGRGIHLILESMTELPNTVLVLLGDGEQRKNFEMLARRNGISERVFFLGSINQEELINYTAAGDIGLALIENISISYYHALPNKLFEYIMAGLPVLSCDLPQMKRIVDLYEVGESINIDKSENIKTVLKHWFDNPMLLNKYRINCGKASLELNWEAEYKKTCSALLGK